MSTTRGVAAYAAVHESVVGPSRHFAVAQQLGSLLERSGHQLVGSVRRVGRK
jgi:hypothetical protein